MRLQCLNLPIVAPGLTTQSIAPIVPITAKNGAPSSIMTAPEVNRSLHEWKPETEDDHAVLAIRNLVCDLCMQNGGGHAGSALGMAAIGVALWKHTMRFNPSDTDWFDRDRFVLSNGECFCTEMGTRGY